MSYEVTRHGARIVITEHDEATDVLTTTVLHPDIEFCTRLAGLANSADSRACITGRIVQVSGDDYGFPGHIEANVDIEWTHDDGTVEPERITLPGDLWDAALLER